MLSRGNGTGTGLAAALVCVLTVACGLLVVSSHGQAGLYRKPLVFLVHSYHEESPWVVDVNRGLNQALSGSGTRLEVMYMDTKHHTDEGWMVQKGEEAMGRVKSLQPDVVIACDDNAQAYFGSRLARLPDAPPIVFCGVNGDPREYGYDTAKATGVLERLKLKETVALLSRIYAGARNIAVIGDASPTAKIIRRTYADADLCLEVATWGEARTFSEWKDFVLTWCDKADALMVVLCETILDDSGTRRVEPERVMEWTTSACRKPIVGLWDFVMEQGALLGIVESGEAHGREAGLIARRILSGEDPRDIEAGASSKGDIIINVREARRINFEIPYKYLKLAHRIIGDQAGRQGGDRLNGAP